VKLRRVTLQHRSVEPPVHPSARCQPQKEVRQYAKRLLPWHPWSAKVPPKCGDLEHTKAHVGASDAEPNSIHTCPRGLSQWHASRHSTAQGVVTFKLRQAMPKTWHVFVAARVARTADKPWDCPWQAPPGFGSGRNDPRLLATAGHHTGQHALRGQALVRAAVTGGHTLTCAELR
jgi:hypothetical protein